jgi:aspartyl protease family protein
LAPSINPIVVVSLLTVSLLLTDCTGCSRSGGRRNRAGRPTETVTIADPQPEPVQRPKPAEPRRADLGANEIALEDEGGVYKIPVTVNGTAMKFILDTGASLISISEVEAGFLYKQGTIGEEDVLEKAKFSDANGDISEGTIINLRSVQIGNRTLRNVRASVVSGGAAPLLLGQSALAQFGRVSLDYGRKTVSFD